MNQIISISGGSGSGKTTLARWVQERLGLKTQILSQDHYYFDQSHRFDRDGGSVNFDHPSAIEWGLLEKHLQDLKKGKSIEVPRYDFATHSRLKEKDPFEPSDVVVVDGTLLLSQKELLDFFDIKVFLDVPESLRYESRLKRDVNERGRTPEGVQAQFMGQVKPMHDQYVQPSQRHADWILRSDQEIETFLKKLESDLKPNKPPASSGETLLLIFLCKSSGSKQESVLRCCDPCPNLFLFLKCFPF